MQFAHKSVWYDSSSAPRGIRNLRLRRIIYILIILNHYLLESCIFLDARYLLLENWQVIISK